MGLTRRWRGYSGNLVVRFDGTDIAGETRRSAIAELIAVQRINAEGRWIIPGLRDLHTHSMVNTPQGNRPDVLGSAASATRTSTRSPATTRSPVRASSFRRPRKRASLPSTGN